MFQFICFFFLVIFGFQSYADTEETNAPTQVTLSADQVGKALSSVDHENQQWRFSVTPIMWLPGAAGQFTEGPLVLEFDVSTSDRVSQLNPGGEIFLELSNGKWSFVLQPQFSDETVDGTLHSPYGSVPAEIRSDTLAFDFWAARRFTGKNVWMEVLLGGKSFDMQVKTKTVLGTGKTTIDWWDPMVGVRGQYQITEHWDVEGLVTAAGFGLSDTTSEGSYEARASVNYAPNDKWRFLLGYRTYDVTNKEHEGRTQSEKFDLKMRGPFLAIGYKF